MPNGMKEMPIIPPISEKIEEEYLKLWSRVQPKKESRNPKPEAALRSGNRLQVECASRKRKRAAKDCFEGKLSRNSGVLIFTP